MSTDLHLLSVSGGFSHGLNDMGSGCWDYSNLSFSVLHGELDHDFDSFPFL